MLVPSDSGRCRRSLSFMATVGSAGFFFSVFLLKILSCSQVDFLNSRDFGDFEAAVTMLLIFNFFTLF